MSSAELAQRVGKVKCTITSGRVICKSVEATLHSLNQIIEFSSSVINFVSVPDF